MAKLGNIFIMGDERVVEGTILMVDLANSIVKLKCD